jgi:hemolysin activation/secretion protein
VNEDPAFTKVTAQLTRTQTLFEPWPDASVAMKLLVAGQYSPDVLPPVEKFFLGGPDYTRGFWAGEVTGDSALAWTVELQLNTGLDFQLYHHPIDLAAQFYAFYDHGETWESQPQDPNHRLSSFGGGLRLNVTRFTEFDLEGVTRFTRTPQGTQGNVLPLHADAIYWRVLTRF